MKRLFALTLVLSLVLCGCGGKTVETAPAQTTAAPAQTTAAPTTEPTTVPTTEPAPVYRNPLNGQILEEPFTGRIYASTISNIPDALPHVGVMHADILMEMFVNGSIIRDLALFTDISAASAVGSVRSTRLMFNDIAQHYNAILLHAGGSSQVRNDAKARGITNWNVDSLDRQSDQLANDTAYRDTTYKRGLEHSLFVNGPGVVAYADAQGIPMTESADKDYGMVFAEDGAPVDGTPADKITITFSYGQSRKDTVMEYYPEVNKYVYNQYGNTMMDQITSEYEAFTNVIVMQANITTNGIYHTADFVAGGTGYYANGGKMVPITWTCDGEDSPFRFLTAEGEPLTLGVGNTYIAVCTPQSPVVAEPVTLMEDATSETAAP